MCPYMSALAHGFASARFRASRAGAFIVFIIAFSRGSFAASQACEEKIITRTETVALTRDSRDARVTLDVLLACFCFDRARRAQDRRVDEIMREADEINRKADAAAASPPRSSRSGDV